MFILKSEDNSFYEACIEKKEGQTSANYENKMELSERSIADSRILQVPCLIVSRLNLSHSEL
jgi:hypothetical protein